MKMKSLKYMLFTIMFAIIMLFSNKVFAVDTKTEYTIENYDVYIKVNEDNTFDITEKITANFAKPKHGILRKIPLKNTVQRTDGTKSKNRAKISNINVDNPYSISTNNGYKIIQIGSENETITGRNTYTIKYKYDIGKDPLKDADELYYNIIGTQWDTYIEKVNFTIEMPKEFDESSLGFSSGYLGSTSSANVTYEVNGNIITGTTNKKLYEKQGLTIRLTLPEGYFNVTNEFDFYALAIIGISIVFVGISYIIWVKYGKDNQIIETVEFYPPEGYNSAELEFMYKGKCEDTGVVSLLIYLADKGYLKIEEKQKKEFTITKLKEYSGNNISEKLFFDKLFEKGEEVTLSSLYNNFYKTVGKIKDEINSDTNENKIFEKASSKKSKILVGMCYIIAIFTILKLLLENGAENMLFMVIFPIIAIHVLRITLKSKNNISKIFGIIWALGFGGVPIFIATSDTILNTINIAMIIVGIVSIAIIIILIILMPKRTSYGNEILGKIRGFKRFLETAEKEQLEELVEKNPEYFYNILPYTYVLGISKTWIKKFETIAIQEPNWYISTSQYDFGKFMESTMLNATRIMTSSPIESSGVSSGGSSSGGGFSGGGSGRWRRKLMVRRCFILKVMII